MLGLVAVALIVSPYNLTHTAVSSFVNISVDVHQWSLVKAACTQEQTSQESQTALQLHMNQFQDNKSCLEA